MQIKRPLLLMLIKRKKSDTTETLRASPTNQDLSIEIKGQVGAAVERLLPQILTHQLSQAFGDLIGQTVANLLRSCLSEQPPESPKPSL